MSPHDPSYETLRHEINSLEQERRFAITLAKRMNHAVHAGRLWMRIKEIEKRLKRLGVATTERK